MKIILFSVAIYVASVSATGYLNPAKVKAAHQPENPIKVTRFAGQAHEIIGPPGASQECELYTFYKCPDPTDPTAIEEYTKRVATGVYTEVTYRVPLTFLDNPSNWIKPPDRLK